MGCKNTSHLGLALRDLAKSITDTVKALKVQRCLILSRLRAEIMTVKAPLGHGSTTTTRPPPSTAPYLSSKSLPHPGRGWLYSLGPRERLIVGIPRPGPPVFRPPSSLLISVIFINQRSLSWEERSYLSPHFAGTWS